MGAATADMLVIFGVRCPVAKPVPKEKIRFQGPKMTVGRERPLIYEYVRYPSWEAAVAATGLSKAALRWKLERR